jgi:putative flippase GtrA
VTRDGDKPGHGARPARLLRFAVVGAIAFVLTGAILFALLRVGVPTWVAQVPAIGVGLVTTYVLNRSFTFRAAEGASPAEFTRYVATSATGAAVNYLTFLLAIGVGLSPFIALVAGTATGMVTNFLGYEVYVFSRR